MPQRITKESWEAIADSIIYIIENDLHDPDEQEKQLREYLQGEDIMEVIDDE